MRLSTTESTRVTSDFALLERAAPFIANLAPRPRGEVMIVLGGQARFEEGSRRRYLVAGDVTVSDVHRGGTEAHSGDASRVLIVEWEAEAGVRIPGDFAVGRMGARDLARLDAAAAAFRVDHSVAAIRTIFQVLRSVGFAFEPAALRELEAPADARDRAVCEACDAQLSRLETYPAVEDVADALGSNARQVNRRLRAMAMRYMLPWSHWRGALRHARMASVLRLLSVPRATTEQVARLTGFRSPTALCHAMADGGLPSPGVLARAATRDVLDAWTAFAA
jgi:hypothetical protein